MGAFQLQTWYHNCGAYAIINSAHALGFDLDYDTVRSLARTSRSNGTTRSGIIRALPVLGFNPTPYMTRNPDNAWKWAFKWCDKNPLIILADHYEHYAVLSGKIDKRIILVDSGGWSDGNDMGVEALDKQELLDRWIHRGVCYAIRVSKA